MGDLPIKKQQLDLPINMILGASDYARIKVQEIQREDHQENQ